MADDGVRARARVPDQRLRRLLGVPPVRRGHPHAPATAVGAGCARSGEDCASTSTTRCSSRRSPTRCAAAMAGCQPASRLVFTAHSVPIVGRQRGGPARRGRPPLLPADRARRPGWSPHEIGVAEYDVVWQSRSGPPQVPWLEPDIVDHVDALHAAGVPGVVVSPIGFVSDHLEVVWDLDNEARERAAENWHGVRAGGHARHRPALRRTRRRTDPRARGRRAGTQAVARSRRPAARSTAHRARAAAASGPRGRESAPAKAFQRVPRVRTATGVRSG